MYKFIILLLLSFMGFAQQKVYRNLVMEGGGIKGVAYGGALIELESRGVLLQIQRVGGTSAGAIQACLLAVGYSAAEISQIIADTPIETFNDWGTVFRAGERFLKKFGWYATLVHIAQEGIFNLPTKTPLESASEVNLWRAFHWLSFDKASKTWE